MKSTNQFKQFLYKYMHILLPIVYGFLYLTAFDYVEKTVTTNFHIVHMRIDDYIPFCEIFIIPYMLWFAYVAVTVIAFMSLNRFDYYRLCIMLGIGMTVFIIISFLFPNGHLLRPETFTRDNIFISITKYLYTIDTATNLFPSIHCYNSLAVHAAINHNEVLRKKKWIPYSSLILCISILLSTVFLKQHSFFDVLTAFAMFAPLYIWCYKCNSLKALKTFCEKYTEPTEEKICA